MRKNVADLYDIGMFEAAITAVTDQLISKLKAWQQRSLDTVYPIIWFDAIHYKVKDIGRFISKAVNSLLGVNIEGHKEFLGLYLSESQGVNYWLYQSAITLNHFEGLNLMIPVLKISHLEQLNNEIFALLPTRLSCLKIDHLLKRIGIICVDGSS